MDSLGAIVFLLLAAAATLPPDGLLKLAGAPPDVVFRVQRGFVLTHPVVYLRELVSSHLTIGGHPQRVAEYAFLGQCAAVLLANALVLGLALAWLRLRRVALTELFRVTPRGASFVLKTTVGIGGGVLGIAAVAAALAARLFGDEPLRWALDQLDLPLLASPWGALGTSALMIVLAPLAEETIFRGIAYRALKRWLPVPHAAVAQATLFGLFHLGSGWPAEFLPFQYGFALLAAYAVERTGSLGAGVLLHATGNAGFVLLTALVMSLRVEIVAALR